MKAQLKCHNGNPTIFLDDQPIFSGIHLLGSLDPNFHDINQQILREYAGAGIHIFSIDSVGPEWCGPRPGNKSRYDFAATAPRLQEVLDADPNALFLLRMGFETRYLLENWWNKMYPEELDLLSNGQRIAQSYASTIWQAEVKDLLAAYINHLKETNLFDRVIAYQICTGTCGEWIKDWSSMDLNCGDYSEPMKRYFRTWLRDKYVDNIAKMRAAWNNPEISFETAEIPPAPAQMSTTHFLFRDPRKEQQVVDFYECYANLCADSLLDFCHTVKTITNGEKLTGAFYGYLMELSWNDSFFNNNYGDITNADVSTTQRSGHLGLAKLLRSDDIDFFVSPYGYAFRGLGGDCLPMQPTESLRVHNKLYLLEEDTLMHNNFDPGGRMHPFDNSIAIYQRNFAQVITHGIGITWLETSSFMESPRIVDDAHRWLARYQALGNWALRLDRTPAAETAVFLDDESFYYQTNQNNIILPLVWQQRVISLNRFGAPHDVYLLNDLLEGNIPPYKLYVFLNPYHLNNRRREALKHILRQQNRTALWLYAPGYLNSDAEAQIGVENMADLTGFQFGRSECYWSPFMHLTNFDHPLTQGLPQDLFWNTPEMVGPVFYLEDPQATELGQVVSSLGRCKPGFGVKEFSGGDGMDSNWRSVYLSTPNVPPAVLRGIARYAGVHLYSDAGDVLYATPDLLGVHTIAGGPRRLRLPHRVEVVYDLYQNCIIAEHTDEFTVQLPPASSALYFTGKASLLP